MRRLSIGEQALTALTLLAPTTSACIFDATFDTGEPFLGAIVIRRHMTAPRTRPARVWQRHGEQIPTGPCQLATQLASKLKPGPIEDGFVQTSVVPNILAPIPGGASRRHGHVLHLQVLYIHHRVAVSDRDPLQVVAADIADPGVDALNSGFDLLPVAAEFCFAAHCTLRTA